MESEKDGSEGTDAKSPDTNKSYQERFNSAIEGWKKDGCPKESTKEAGGPCGAAPHKVGMLPEKDGYIVMTVNCAAGHERVWEFAVPAAEMKAEVERKMREAEASGGIKRDPTKASVTITMDLKTQQFSINEFVPTPGLGIQLAGVLMSHYFAKLQEGNRAPADPAVALRPKPVLHPRTGKPLFNN